MAAMDSTGIYLESIAGYHAIDPNLEPTNTLNYCHGIALQTSVFKLK
jgi:hypothetical protein